MKNLFITLSLILITSVKSYSQNDSTVYYDYFFKIENITNPDDAKAIIVELRALTKEKIFYFNNETDVFRLKTHNLYEEDEFLLLLLSNNYQALIVE